jgi:ABC-2 type transport system ATP-binding protein
VLLTTHYLEEADALADRIVMLDRGRIVAEGTPAEIKARVLGKRIRCQTRLTAAELAALPGVRSVSDMRRLPDEKGEVEILAAEAEPVLRLLLSRDPDLSGLDVRGAGLEEAFLSLTGGDHQETDKEVAA